MIFIGEFFEIGCEAGKFVRKILVTDKDAAAGLAARGAMESWRSGIRRAGGEAADVKQFVGVRVVREFVKDAFEAARSGPLLGDERDDEGAVYFRWIDAAEKLYKSGVAARDGARLLADLGPSPAYETLVEASGGWGVRVEKPQELRPALERAVAVVTREKRQALVNVVCRY